MVTQTGKNYAIKKKKKKKTSTFWEIFLFTFFPRAEERGLILYGKYDAVASSCLG